MMYFLMMWDRSRGISYSKATTILPICLQIDVCNALFGPCLMTVYEIYMIVNCSAREKCNLVYFYYCEDSILSR